MPNYYTYILGSTGRVILEYSAIKAGVQKLIFGLDLTTSILDKSDFETGTHLFETCPSGNFYESKAIAIGAKCQSAKTYLEKNFETFNKISRDDLIKHGLRALKASAQEEELSVNNVSVGVVSASEKFHLLSESELQVNQ